MRTRGKIIDFADALRKRRERRGETLADLAKRIPADKGALSRWETKRRGISPETAVRLAEAHDDLEMLRVYCRQCPVAAALLADGAGPDQAA